ncbi:bifunctional diaminohydroxyphosphoribosylaminopyrimidine deaminase/5-amino-6-(5-phosphoribosylamino)uracil reductase RibD [Oceanithermus sp.]
MRRALALAERARGHTSPNPIVGAVIVNQGRVVGEGFHPRAGEPHAEVFALRQAGEAARGAEVYVTLEPCNHHGRTPPCSQALLEAGVSRVVYAASDPGERSGGGGKRLRRAGVRVEAGLLEEEARAQNRAFFHAAAHKRPLVLWKAALTLDGRVAASGRGGEAVSNPLSHRVAHGYRQACAAVAVGAGTVRADDPALTVRAPDFRAFPAMVEPPPLRDPLKVVFDGRAQTPPSARLFEPGPRGEPARVLVFVGESASADRVRALEAAGAEIVTLPEGEGGLSVKAALSELYRRGIDSLLLEGGPRLAGSFVRAGLVDRAAFFMAPRILGEGRGLIEGFSFGSMQKAMRFRPERTEELEGDLWLEGRLEVS